MADEETGGGGGGNLFTRKLGPLPMWAWMGVGLGAALAYTSWSKNKKAAAAAAAGPPTAGTLPTTQTASGSTPASLIPQFVNQVYNQESPPVTGAPTSAPTTSPQVQRQAVPLDKLMKGNQAGSPWYEITAQPGESWLDITARMYGFGDNYAAVTDPGAKQRVQDVSKAIQNWNNQPGSTGNGPAAGETIYFH